MTVAERIQRATEDLVDAVRAAGHSCTYARGDMHLGDDVIPCTVRETMTGGMWSSRGTGRLRIVVGDYGEKRQFPEPRMGFDFPKVAAAVIACAARARAKRERRARFESEEREANATVTAVNETRTGAAVMRAPVYVHTSKHDIIIALPTNLHPARLARIVEHIDAVLAEDA